MKKNTFFLTIALLLTACGRHDGSRSPAANGSPYRTTAPSLLYFKNMRSAYYDQSEQPGARMELYRLRKLNPPPQETNLIPVIANNWLKDEAYLLLETSGLSEPLTVRWERQKDSGVYRLQPASVDKQYELGIQLYESLQAGHRLSALASDSTWVPLFEGRDMRSHFTTTIRDYLRLTEAL